MILNACKKTINALTKKPCAHLSYKSKRFKYLKAITESSFSTKSSFRPQLQGAIYMSKQSARNDSSFFKIQLIKTHLALRQKRYFLISPQTYIRQWLKNINICLCSLLETRPHPQALIQGLKSHPVQPWLFYIPYA